MFVFPCCSIVMLVCRGAFCNQIVTLDPWGTSWGCHSAQDIATYREAILSLEEDKQWSKAIDILDEAQSSSWCHQLSPLWLSLFLFPKHSQTVPGSSSQIATRRRCIPRHHQGFDAQIFIDVWRLTSTPSPLFIVVQHKSWTILDPWIDRLRSFNVHTRWCKT